MGIIDQSNSNGQPSLNWAIILFQTPIYCPLNSLIIGSHFDTDIQLNTCRLAFSGRIIQNFDEKQDTSRIRIYTKKEKTAIVTRLGDAYCRKSDQKTIRFEVYGSDLFKKETNMSPFMGMILHTDDPNEVGKLSFHQFSLLILFYSQDTFIHLLVLLENLKHTFLLEHFAKKGIHYI